MEQERHISNHKCTRSWSVLARLRFVFAVVKRSRDVRMECGLALCWGWVGGTHARTDEAISCSASQKLQLSCNLVDNALGAEYTQYCGAPGSNLCSSCIVYDSCTKPQTDGLCLQCLQLLLRLDLHCNLRLTSGFPTLEDRGGSDVGEEVFVASQCSVRALCRNLAFSRLCQSTSCAAVGRSSPLPMPKSVLTPKTSFTSSLESLKSFNSFPSPSSSSSSPSSSSSA